MILAFGPSGSYFFDDGKGTRRWNVSPAFDKHMATYPAIRISTLVLGEGGAFFVNRCSNEILRTHNNDFLDPENRYPELKAWLFDDSLGHSRDKVFVTLGSGGTFWAVSNAGYRWVGAPEELQAYFQKYTSPALFATKRVHTVDLGYGETFLGIGIDNTWFWNLDKYYGEMDSVMRSRKDMV